MIENNEVKRINDADCYSQGKSYLYTNIHRSDVVNRSEFGVDFTLDNQDTELFDYSLSLCSFSIY